MSSRLRRAGMTLAALVALGVAGCGGNDDDGGGATATQAATAAKGTDLSAIKDYLLAHTERLVADTGKLRADAEAYYALAKGADFDYGRLLADKRSEVAATVKKLQTDFADANPAYEEMEGVVAGVPSLADFDVIIDAGGDASDPENAVPFSVKTPAGQDLQAAGQLQLPDRDEHVRHRAPVRGQGREARPRRRRQGRVRRGAARRRLPGRRRARLRDERQGARRRRAQVEPDPAGRLHRARRHDPDDVRVLRGVEELALHRRRQGRRRRPSSSPRACRTSPTSSAA